MIDYGDAVIMPASRSGQIVGVLMDPDDAAALGTRRLSIGSHGYAQTCPPETGRVVPLHRHLLGLVKGDGKIGDHINREPLDCRRSNLRVVDPSGSSQNVSGRGASPYRGVAATRSGRWSAQVKFRGVIHNLGVYDTQEEAAVVAAAWRAAHMPFST